MGTEAEAACAVIDRLVVLDNHEHRTELSGEELKKALRQAVKIACEVIDKLHEVPPPDNAKIGRQRRKEKLVGRTVDSPGESDA